MTTTAKKRIGPRIESMIFQIRGERVILDNILARIYGVTTARLNQQVRRNLDRFPADFVFLLSREEFDRLMLQNATSNKGRGGRRKLPLVFTEHGAIMAANVLNSKRAVQMSIFVVRAFIKMRQTMTADRALLEQLQGLEKKLTQRLDSHEQAIVYVLAELRKLMEPPLLPEPKRRTIGFQREGK